MKPTSLTLTKRSNTMSPPPRRPSNRSSTPLEPSPQTPDSISLKDMPKTQDWTSPPSPEASAKASKTNLLRPNSGTRKPNERTSASRGIIKRRPPISDTLTHWQHRLHNTINLHPNPRVLKSTRSMCSLLSPTMGTVPRLVTSESSPRTPAWLKPPWAKMMTATPSPYTPNLRGCQRFTMTKTPLQSPSSNGSSPSSKETAPTTRSSQMAQKILTIGGSQLTSLATKSSLNASMSFAAHMRESTLPLPPHARSAISSSTDWPTPVPLRALTSMSRSPKCPAPTNMGIDNFDSPHGPRQALPELVGKLSSTQRVMTLALTTQALPYRFCQELSPFVAHDGGPCMCYQCFG